MRTSAIRPPIFDPTRMSRASTVPEPSRRVSRCRQAAYSAVPAAAASKNPPIRICFFVMAPAPWESSAPLPSPSTEAPGRNRCATSAARSDQATTSAECQKPTVGTHVATPLADFHELSKEQSGLGLLIAHLGAHRFTGEIGQQNQAHNFRISPGLFRQPDTHLLQDLGDRFVGAAGLFNEHPQLADLHVTKGNQDVILAREIVEECSFAYVCIVSDVFNTGLGEALLREQSQRGAE